MPEESFASGFALRLNSAILEGQANAGSAVIDDPLAMFTNPATAILHERAEIALHGVGLFPVTKFRGTTTNPLFPPIIDKANSHNAAKSALIPSMAFVIRPHDQLSLGVVGTSPFGLGFDYGKHWGGNRYVVQSNLKTINVTPIAALKLNDNFSIGGGVQIQNSGARFTSQTASPNPLAQFLFQESGTRQKAKVHRWNVGWTAGILFQPTPSLKIGFSFRSQIRSTLRGFLTFTNVPPVFKENLFLQASRVKTKIKFPSVFTLSTSYDLTPEWTALADITRTNWSSIKQIVLSTPLDPLAEIIQQKWKDTWFFGAGINYKQSDKWVFRGGFAFDQGPSRTKYRVPGIPDSDKYIASLGATYIFNEECHFSFSYVHEFFRKAGVNLKNSNIGNAGKGNLKGHLRTHVDYIGLQINYKI